MIKKTALKVLLFLLTLALGLGLFYYLVAKQGIDEIVLSIHAFGITPFFGFVLLSIANFYLYSLRWQIILNSLLPENNRLSIFKIFMNRLAGFAVNYLTPAAQVGGEPVRIAMLNADGVPLKEATSSVLLDITFELTAYAAFILVGVIMALSGGLIAGYSLWLILGGVALILIILMTVFYEFSSGKELISRAFNFTGLGKLKALKTFGEDLRQMEKMMTRFLNHNYSLIFLVGVLSFFMLAFRVFEMYFIAHFLGFNLNFAQAFLIATLPGFALLLPVPAGLGVFEGSFAVIFVLLVVPLNAVAFALVIRARDLLFIVTGALYLISKGHKFIQKKIFAVK